MASEAVATPKASSEHAFDKLHVIDCTLAELETALDGAEIIEERRLDERSSKELMLAGDVEIATRHFASPDTSAA